MVVFELPGMSLWAEAAPSLFDRRWLPCAALNILEDSASMRMLNSGSARSKSQKIVNQIILTSQNETHITWIFSNICVLFGSFETILKRFEEF